MVRASTENMASMISLRRTHMLISLYFFIHLLLPLVDLLTDINYLLENLFFSSAMFYVMLVYIVISAIVIPMYQLSVRLVQYGATPRFYYTQNRLIWLCFAKYKYTNHISTEDGEYWDYAPHYYTDTWRGWKGDFGDMLHSDGDTSKVLVDTHQGRKLCWFVVSDHIDIGGALLNLIMIIVYFTLQIASIPLYICSLLVQFMFTVFWFFIGVILLWTKVDAMGTVWTTWFHYWTWSDDFAAEFEDPNVAIDTEVFNGSMFMHCFFHSIPHILLQVINNTLVRKPWRWYAILSAAMSGYLIASGVYIFMYHRFCRVFGVRKSELEDVPQILSVIGFKLLTLTPAKKSRPLKLRAKIREEKKYPAESSHIEGVELSGV